MATPQPAPVVKSRVNPGPVAMGHYLRTLTGRKSDVAAMTRLGAVDAARNRSGERYVVLLDIGGQVRSGVLLSLTGRFIDYLALERAAISYADGYHAHQRSNAPVTIALGTNNDVDVSPASGVLWARVVNAVRAATASYPNMTIAGANDIEPGFSANAPSTRGWLRGFLAATPAPFIFNGSADGCFLGGSRTGCGSGWRPMDLVQLAGSMAPDRTSVLPQIYNTTMAKQWARLTLLAHLHGFRDLNILGPLTENAACGNDPTCPTMPSSSAWTLLWNALHVLHIGPNSMPVQVDLNVR